MKKLLSAVLCASCLFAGCSSNEESKPEMSFDTFESLLAENGIEVSGKTEMMAQMIGAEEGYKYESENADFELYKFDTSSDEYKKAKKDGVVSLNGLGEFDVVVNGEYVLPTSGIDESIVDAFAEY